MIIIRRGTINTGIALTLTEKNTLCPPAAYLFCFKSIQENREVYFVGTDISPDPLRYNLFTIEESDTPDPVNAVVTLNPEGFWTYTIYDQSSTTNLDPTDASVAGVVETGRVKVIETVQTYKEHDITGNTYVAHEPS